MFVLRSSDASPFGRKVKISAYVLGLMDQIKVEAADTMDAGDSLRTQNPLGKIPALVLEDGTALYDSRVIVEYLDHLAAEKSIFPDGTERFAALRLQALADGVVDAAILQVYEMRYRPEQYRYEGWLEHQSGKVSRGLASLAATPPARPTGSQDVTIGQISLACALGYLDLRFEGAWRKEYPALETWLNDFRAAVPAFDKTGMPVS